MAPKRNVQKKLNIGRSKSVANQNLNPVNDEPTKRKAVSPLKPLSKRSAFVDITNDAVTKKTNLKGKDDKSHAAVKYQIPKKHLKEHPTNENRKFSVPGKLTVKSTLNPASSKSAVLKVNNTLKQQTASQSVKTEPNKSEDLEAVSIVAVKGESPNCHDDSSSYVTAEEESGGAVSKYKIPKEAESRRRFPPGVDDFDAENAGDLFQVSEYAMDIFGYLKDREYFFIESYMEKQAHINATMRALLVDWLVEMQENFELNHETLYLAVKLVDIYLSKVTVRRETLQLVGAASLFVASKYDEHMPPMIEDLIYVCDGAYTKSELIRMEINILQKVDFRLGIPLSYRFLRRYARCSKQTMPVLTLARYILELSLLEYSFVFTSESKLAAAALLLALRMKGLGSWTPTLEHYSGYKLEDIKELVLKLNNMLHQTPNEQLSTVRNKYSHPIFFEVAKSPLLETIDL